jgi:hypothetical protein
MISPGKFEEGMYTDKYKDKVPVAESAKVGISNKNRYTQIFVNDFT